MKYLGAISDSKDLVNKGYVDTIPNVDVSGANVVNTKIVMHDDTSRKKDPALNYNGTQLSAQLVIGDGANRSGSIKLGTGNGDAYYSTINTSLTANRTVTLPDKTGTIALTSDIPTVPSQIVNTIKGDAESSYRYGNVNITAANVGALASADLYTRSAAGGLDWSTETANKIIAKSALAFWNGSYDGSTSNLQRLNATVYVGGTQMKDFVKEQGTSSSWYYRKWNSGKIEAWTTYNAGSQTPSKWTDYMYYKDVDITIPSGIFSAAPNHTVATNNGSDYQFMVHTARATSATNIRVRCVKPNSGGATPVIALYVSNMV